MCVCEREYKIREVTHQTLFNRLVFTLEDAIFLKGSNQSQGKILFTITQVKLNKFSFSALRISFWETNQNWSIVSNFSSRLRSLDNIEILSSFCVAMEGASTQANFRF